MQLQDFIVEKAVTLRGSCHHNDRSPQLYAFHQSRIENGTPYLHIVTKFMPATHRLCTRVAKNQNTTGFAGDLRSQQQGLTAYVVLEKARVSRRISHDVPRQ
jgi:hypothetical protein